MCAMLLLFFSAATALLLFHLCGGAEIYRVVSLGRDELQFYSQPRIYAAIFVPARVRALCM